MRVLFLVLVVCSIACKKEYCSNSAETSCHGDITKNLQILTPNMSDTLKVGTKHVTKWSGSEPGITAYNVQLTVVNHDAAGVLLSVNQYIIGQAKASDCNFTWVVPNVGQHTNCLLSFVGVNQMFHVDGNRFVIKN